MSDPLPSASPPGLDESWDGRPGTDLRRAVEQFYVATFNDDAPIRRHLAPGYVQHVDGRTLRFDDFLAHVRFLRGATQSLRFEVLDAAYAPGLLADRHRVHFVRGDAADRGMGSRVC